MDFAFAHVLLTIAENIALAVFALVALPWLHKRTLSLGKHGISAGLGLIFGCVVVLGMLDPTVIAPGVFIDGRAPLMALAGFIGGPITAAVATVIASAYRLWVGGLGMGVGIANVALAGAIGVGVRWMALQRDASLRTAHLLPLAILTAALPFVPRLFLPASLQHELFGLVAAPLAVGSIAGVMIFGFLLLREQRRIEIEAALGRKTE